MLERHRLVGWIAVALLAAVLRPPLPAMATQKAAQKADPKKEVLVAGIMFDHDRKANWMTVKADGEEEPVKYLIDPSNKELAEVLQSVFNVSRVRLKYRLEGDSRRLVAIQRQILQAEGTMTGTVVKVHNDFWIELKPRRGVADAFALGPANFNDKAFVEKMKALKPGDSVTIQFTTDFERHRIVAIRKNAPPKQASPKAESKGTASKEKK